MLPVVLLPPPLPQATCNKLPPTTSKTSKQLSSFRRFGTAIPTMPSTMAGRPTRRQIAEWNDDLAEALPGRKCGLWW